MSKFEELHQTALTLNAEELNSVESSGANLQDIAAERRTNAARWCAAQACGLSQEIVDAGTDEKSVVFSCVTTRCDSPGLVVEASLDTRDAVVRLSAS